jgi:excinuclease ABC subunit A
MGGQVVAQGSAEQLMRCADSITGRFLAQPLAHPLGRRRPVGRATPSIEVIGAHLHNLKNIRARLPLGRMIVITGVSGSGKSTLARDVLYTNLLRLLGEKRRKREGEPIGCDELLGWEQIGRVLEVDQTPIGKTPRSCPATYVGFWDTIRRLFAATGEARMRGYNAGRFSFNTTGGRCEACEGQGVKKIEMSFLPDVKVLCDACSGQRFAPETLAVRYKGKSIGDVLLMSVDEATEFFAPVAAIHRALKLLREVGLGYLTLGQQSPTLSGGEAQRIKLVAELSKVRLDTPDLLGKDVESGSRAASDALKRTFYVLDEPTVGLHMADVEKLIRALHRLVDAGNTVVVIEHNLDIMAEADWIIDLGPEGGAAGGQIVAQGAPEDVIATTALPQGTQGVARPRATHTATVLRDFLRTRTRDPALFS